MKIAVASLAAICLLAAVCVNVYTDCHDSMYCEHVVKELVDMYWDKPNNNTVNYKINVDYNPRDENPNLGGTSDVQDGAALWNNLEYKGITVPYKALANGITQAKAERYDGENVVSWLGVRDHNLKARCVSWPVAEGSKEIEESDIMFNYYIDYVVHAQIGSNPNKYCLTAMAAHEFGHFAGLEDARPGFCDTEYSKYTMYKTPYKGTKNCKKETLECEDKFALHHTYTVLNPNN